MSLSRGGYGGLGLGSRGAVGGGVLSRGGQRKKLDTRQGLDDEQKEEIREATRSLITCGILELILTNT